MMHGHTNLILNKSEFGRKILVPVRYKSHRDPSRCFMRSDEQKDTTKLIVAFRSYFANAPKHYHLI